MPERPRLTPAMADVRRAVRECWERNEVSAGDLVLVACSGGADSLALAAAAIFEGSRAGVSVGAVIVEHGLQPATKQVAADTAELLTGLGASPVLIKNVKVGKAGGPEAAARSARYEAIDGAVKETYARFVLLAHTMNDQAETVLLGLARGSGNKSLNGMPERSGRYLRPLLSISRATTEAFCEDSGLTYWIDPQNADKKYTRVRVRQEILPMLETELGPGIVEALARTAEQLQEDEAVLSALAQSYFDEFVKVRATAIEISVSDYFEMPLAIRHRVLAIALQKMQAPEFARVHMLAVDELVDNWHGQKPLTLPGVRVERNANQIVLKSTRAAKTGAC
ncbi:MAG: tRNA lysidine(34) synthetase TilS [Micrococcales bacterium]